MEPVIDPVVSAEISYKVSEAAYELARTNAQLATLPPLTARAKLLRGNRERWKAELDSWSYLEHVIESANRAVQEIKDKLS